MVQFLIYTIVLWSCVGLDLTSGWSYSQDALDGPANWYQTDANCGGSHQSPINIDTKSAVYDSSLASLDTSSYKRKFADGEATARLINNGRSVQVSFTFFGYSQPLYYLQNGGLSYKYNLEQFNFHWGQTSASGSEHTINGKSSPLEVHFIHYREDLGSVANAKSQENGVVILTVLFKIGKPNSAYDDIVANLANVQYNGKESELKAFSPASLLPKYWKKHYRYTGSLPTPSCDENVTWIVLAQHVTISEAQADAFRHLFESAVGGEEVPLSFNNRPVQPLNDRTVSVSFRR